MFQIGTSHHEQREITQEMAGVLEEELSNEVSFVDCF